MDKQNIKLILHLALNAAVSLLAGYLVVKIDSVIVAIAIMSTLITWFALWPKGKP